MAFGVLLLCFPGLQAQRPPVKERRSEGSTLRIQCSYTPQTDYQQRKAWCRMRDGECDLLVETTDGTRTYPYRTQARKGNVDIVDNQQYSTVSITMTNLQAKDSGTYSCAYRSYSNKYIPLKTISLKVFKSLQAQTPDVEERRSEGSTLHVQCSYTAQTDYQQRKAWCRHVRDDECDLHVETTDGTRTYPYRTRATKGNVDIMDDQQSSTVSITMTNLQAEDSGTYSCAYRFYSNKYIPLRTISLNVFKELHKWELDSLSVQCPYSALGDSTETKAWCRKEGQTECKVIVRTDDPSTQRNTKASEYRTLIQDDTQKTTVNITIQKLQAQDSGVYWCALYRGPRLIRIMEFNLSVSKRTQQYRAEESGNVSVQCPYSIPDYGAVNKAWCKEAAEKPCTVLVNTNKKPSGYLRTPRQGRVMIQDNTQQGTVTITMEKLQASDSGVYWCALYEDTRLFRMAEVTLSISEVLAGTTLPGTAVPSNSTETTINNEEEIKRHSLHIILWLLLGIATSKTLTVVILVLLTRRRKRDSTVKASR